MISAEYTKAIVAWGQQKGQCQYFGGPLPCDACGRPYAMNCNGGNKLAAGTDHHTGLCDACLEGHVLAYGLSELVEPRQ